MEQIQFFPVDVRYKIEGGRAAIHMSGRTEGGEPLIVIDRNCAPYFIVLPKRGADPKEQLLKLEADGGRVVDVQEIEKYVLGVKEKVLQVFVDVPKTVPKVKDAARGLDTVLDVYEADIVFANRYLVDRGIVPMMQLSVEGKMIPYGAHVPVVEATSLESAGKTMSNSKALALDIETYNPDGKILDMEKYAIVMIGLWAPDYQKVLTWKPVEGEHVEVVGGEEEMLRRLSEIIQKYEPDVLLGYNSDGFDLPYLATRAKKYGITLKLGRDYSEMDIKGTKEKKVAIPGIAHVDVLPFIRRVVGRSMKTDSYRLEAVAQELLGEGKHDIDIGMLATHWDAGDKKLADYAYYNLVDARLTYQIYEKILPQLVELVKLVGLPIFEIARMSFSQLVEWYLIKQAQTYEQVIPNKPRFGENQARLEQRAKGGFVFEPTPGLYKDVAVFDFRSLYPSIIVSHNISVETVRTREVAGGMKAPTEDEELWFDQNKQGFLSAVVRDLIERRSRIKELMKKDPDDVLLAARSEGLKVMANSFYGYLGFAPARWYSFACVKSITAWGRDYISKVIAKARDKGYSVVYGDTDSVFLQLQGGEEAALAFMHEVNQALSGMMELEYEGTFRSGIFVSAKGSDVGAKKRYALMRENGELVVKGFEIVRRNFSGLGKKLQKEVLEILLKEYDSEKALKHVRGLVADLKEGKVPISDLAIATKLTKKLDEYDSVGPHVAAARRMQAQGESIVPGMVVRYVIVKGEGRIRDKVRLENEVKGSDIDVNYYIDHQMLPAIEKIFEVFDIDSDQLVKDSSQSSLSGFF